MGMGTQDASVRACPQCGNGTFDVAGLSPHGFMYDAESGTREHADAYSINDEPSIIQSVTCVECGGDCSQLFVDRFGPFSELRPRQEPEGAPDVTDAAPERRRMGAVQERVVRALGGAPFEDQVAALGFALICLFANDAVSPLREFDRLTLLMRALLLESLRARGVH